MGTKQDSSRLGMMAYIFAGLSFIPLVGVVFAIVSIVWGTVSKKEDARNLIGMGASGIGLTILLYSLLFFVHFDHFKQAF